MDAEQFYFWVDANAGAVSGYLSVVRYTPYHAQCSDFGGGGPPAGGGLPFDHDVYVIVDGNQVGWGAYADGIYHPGTYTIDYSFDISDGQNTSRLHFDGWAVVNCTSDTEL